MAEKKTTGVAPVVIPGVPRAVSGDMTVDLVSGDALGPNLTRHEVKFLATLSRSKRAPTPAVAGSVGALARSSERRLVLEQGVVLFSFAAGSFYPELLEHVQLFGRQLS